jgi:hypothetical protein
MDGISKHAAAQLTAMLEEANAPKERCLRFIAVENGEELRFDEEREHDRVFRYADRAVLLVDPLTMQKFSGHKFDYLQGRFCLVRRAKGRLIGG